jgi:hypothetical protein
MPLPMPMMVKVRTPATRVPAFCRLSFQPRSIPISSPQASAVATDSACQYQLSFSAVAPRASADDRP